MREDKQPAATIVTKGWNACHTQTLERDCGQKKARQTRVFVSSLLSYISIMCPIFTCAVTCLVAFFSVLSIHSTPWMGVCVEGAQTYAHVTLPLLYFLAQLCPGDLFYDKCSRCELDWPVMICHVTGGGWRGKSEEEEGVGGGQNNIQRKAGRGPNPFSTYTGLISGLLSASIVLLRHLQLRHIRNIWGKATVKQANS